MFSEVVVALDQYERSGVVLDVAAPVARRAGTALRLVTVASPSMDHIRDDVELGLRRALMRRRSVRRSSSRTTSCLRCSRRHDPTASSVSRREPEGTSEQSSSGALRADCWRTRSRPCFSWGPATKPEPSLDVMEVCVDAPDAAATLVPAAAAWSRRLGSALRLVHAWVPGHERLSSFAAAQDVLDGAARRLNEQFAIGAGSRSEATWRRRRS